MLNHESRMSFIEKAVSGLESENYAVKLKVDDIKGQYQCNINIMGIPEQEKGGKPTEFVQVLIPKLLGEGRFNSLAVTD